MRVALLIAAKDLRQRLRDRSALLIAVVAPLGLAVIFSQLLGNSTEFSTRWVVADMDGGRLALVLRDEVIGSMARADVAAITVVATEGEARSAVADGAQDVAFLIPTGFTHSIERGTPARLEVVGARGSTLSTEIARSLAQRFGDSVVAVQLAVATVRDLSGPSLPPDEEARIVGVAAQAPPPVALVDEVTALRQLSLPSYFSASMAILFLFFSAQVGMVSIFEERRLGTLARMVAGPIRPAMILLGKTLGAFVMGVVAMAVIIVATTLLIGADWGPPVGVAMIAVAGVVSAIGIATLVTSFANNAESAGAASSAVAITLAVLGGTFSPTAQAPEVMATLALFTPHGWFMRGLGDMHGAGSSVADGLPAVAVLLAIGLVTGGLGLLRARRLVVPG
ncbi:MAG TPA: ABC transporter permease [Candidatus Limnocylindrales bacterium]